MKLLIAMPTIDGRENSLSDAIGAFAATTTSDYKMIVVKNAPTCGQGWIDAVDEYVEKFGAFDYVFLASDDQMPFDGWDEPLIEAVDKGFLPCCVILNPDGSVQSAGGDLAMPENVCKSFGVDWAPVGFAPFPFMSREQWDQIGMLPVTQFSDVWVSYRGRQLGYECVLRTESRIVHTYHEVGRERGQQRRAEDLQTVALALGDGLLDGVK